MTTRLDSSSTQMPDSYGSGATLSGWAIFGAIVLLILGTVNVVQGITALQYSDLLVNEYVFDNLDFWGWAFIIWGALQVLAGGMTLAGNEVGITMGLTLASIGAIGWFFMIFAAPAAAVVGIGLSVAVIASLATAFR